MKIFSLQLKHVSGVSFNLAGLRIALLSRRKHHVGSAAILGARTATKLACHLTINVRVFPYITSTQTVMAKVAYFILIAYQL